MYLIKQMSEELGKECNIFDKKRATQFDFYRHRVYTECKKRKYFYLLFDRKDLSVPFLDFALCVPFPLCLFIQKTLLRNVACP